MKAKCMPAFLLPTSDSYHKYFSDEVCDSLELIEADYGLKGFAVVIKLWQKIFGGNEGYYCRWDDKVGSLFAKKIGAGKGFVFEIVNRLIKENVFDADLYQRYGILTSEWIQLSWVEYMKRRPNAKIENAYLLINCTQNSETVSKNGKNANKSHKSVSKNDTTEQNLTKQNLTEYMSTAQVSKKPLGLSQEQYSELCKMSSSASVDKYIDKIIDWQQRSGKLCRDPFKTIKEWAEKDGKLNGVSVNKENSYDLDDYEEFAMNYDLSEVLDKDDKL